ncbi:BPSL0067 family protein [Tolypothrix sp. PCC 7910]|uniref:BPSL0067 family protein n=1 Tax=Tolypothrix sp. PCC 7910 TaxID=2099387 RepID=UPI0014279012|nr:BPSL0067 family protein [Tolypothrix sp. PCC 7910]QIR38854.1 BPSL0067 family protein [Tolypothrix sp. PCC 7910]
MLDNLEFRIDSSCQKLNNASNFLDNNSLNLLQPDWKDFGSQKLLTLAGETLINAWQNQNNPISAMVYATGSIFKSNFAANAHIAFGEAFDVNKAETLGTEILGGNYGVLPDVQFLSNAQMNGALGAYAKSTNTIYINSGFLTENADNPIAIGRVIVEEEGHFLDAYANSTDSPGDEGEILAGLVEGKIFNEGELIPLKAEDDSSVFTINGQSVSVELASPSDFGINLNSNSYTKAGGNIFRYDVLDQCTEFAYGRALEKGLINPNSGVGAKIRGNAGLWDDQAGSWSNQAKANSFVVWDANQGGAGSVGHVAFVERVNANGSFVISEFNWNYGDGKFNSRTINPGTSAFNTAKFIHLDSTIIANSNEARDKVSNFYRDILGREPDANGLQSWLDALSKDKTLAQVRSGFGHSDEAKAKVTAFYRDILGREPDANGLQSWLDALSKDKTLAQVRSGFGYSNEARGKVTAFYRDILGREPDANGLQSWLDALSKDKTLAQVRSGFGYSNEARGKVTAFYRDILGREPDANGLQSWLDALSKDKTLAQVRSGFGHSDEAKAKVTAFYRDILRREPDANGLQSWLDGLGRDMTLAQVRSSIANSNEARRLGGSPKGLMATSDNLTKLLNGQFNGQYIDVDNTGYNTGKNGAFTLYQCWDFVALVTNTTSMSTSNWKKGANIIENRKVELGTAIATFGSNGKYEGHTAIFAGYGTENGVSGFYVWDQNWDGSSVQKHFIRTDRSGTSDADNYYVVQV